MMRQALAKRAATDDSNTEKLIELSRQITYMQNLRFTVRPWDEPESRVAVVAPESIADFPPNCCAMYIAAFLSEQTVQAITSKMLVPKLIVFYKSSDNL